MFYHPLGAEILLCFFSCLAAYRFVALRRKSSGIQLPPSFPAEPFFGHVRRMPQQYSWETFSAWKETLGDIFYLNLMGRPTVVINSVEIARELLDRKGSMFSDRPHSVLMGNLLGCGSTLPFLPYGEKFKTQRRLLLRSFDQQATKAQRNYQEKQVKMFLHGLSENPDDFRDAVKSLVSTLVVKAIYDLDDNATQDIIGSLKEVAMLFAGVSDAGGSMLDFIPIRKCYLLYDFSIPLPNNLLVQYLPTWFPECIPGVLAKRKALHLKIRLEDVMNKAFEQYRIQRVGGVTYSCYMSRLFDEYENMGTQDPGWEKVIKLQGVMIFAAGFDTSVSTLLTFFLMIARNPEAAKRAQTEIDSLTKGERLPTYDDRPHLPFVECVLKEVYRFSSPAPVGFPHKSSQTARFGEWSIPEGSMILTNIWGMLNDPVSYSNPQTFAPERYLADFSVRGVVEKSASETTSNQNDPSGVVFGFGRRICPGKFFADAMTWLIIAQILSVFDISRQEDSKTDGSQVPENSFTSGLVREPKNFACSIRLKKAEYCELLRG